MLKVEPHRHCRLHTNPATKLSVQKFPLVTRIAPVRALHGAFSPHSQLILRHLHAFSYSVKKPRQLIHPTLLHTCRNAREAEEGQPFLDVDPIPMPSPPSRHPLAPGIPAEKKGNEIDPGTAGGDILVL